MINYIYIYVYILQISTFQNPGIPVLECFCCASYSLSNSPCLDPVCPCPFGLVVLTRPPLGMSQMAAKDRQRSAGKWNSGFMSRSCMSMNSTFTLIKNPKLFAGSSWVFMDMISLMNPFEPVTFTCSQLEASPSSNKLNFPVRRLSLSTDASIDFVRESANIA